MFRYHYIILYDFTQAFRLILLFDTPTGELLADSSHPLRSGVPGDHSTFQRKARKRVPCDQSKPTVGSASTPVLVAAITTTRELALH